MSELMRQSVAGGRPERAFTLVEMLMVVVILGIAAAIVVPRVGRTEPFRVQAAARAVVGDLTFAQNEAIGNQQRRTVDFDPAAESYRVLRPGNGGDEVCDAPWLGGDFVVNFGPNSQFGAIDIVSTSFNNNSISFDDLGAPSEGGTVVLAAGERTFSVSVAPLTGRITVSEGQGG